MLPCSGLTLECLSPACELWGALFPVPVPDPLWALLSVNSSLSND